jgi:hypothetical protein
MNEPELRNGRHRWEWKRRRGDNLLVLSFRESSGKPPALIENLSITRGFSRKIEWINCGNING